MLLNLPGQCVKIPGADVARRFAPWFKCSTGSIHSRVYVGSPGLRNLRDGFASRRIDTLKVLAPSRLRPAPVEVNTLLRPAFLQPVQRDIRRFWCGAVIHRLEELSNLRVSHTTAFPQHKIYLILRSGIHRSVRIVPTPQTPPRKEGRAFRLSFPFPSLRGLGGCILHKTKIPFY